MCSSSYSYRAEGQRLIELNVDHVSGKFKNSHGTEWFKMDKSLCQILNLIPTFNKNLIFQKNAFIL